MQRDFQVAMAAEDSGDLDRAQSLLSSLHDRLPGVFEINESLGLLFAEREKYSQALPLLELAVRERPESSPAHANLGAALYKLHRNQDAIAAFQHAVLLNPSNEGAQQSLGRVLMDEEKPTDAVRALTAALRLNPADTDLQLDCATALITANQLGDARKILSNFVDADHSARAQALLGEADEQEKDFASAGKHFSNAVALEPSEENAWLLSLELLRHWTFGAAAIELEAASAKFPESKRMRIGLGAAYFGNAEYSKAIPVFADLLETDANNAVYAELLGLSCTAVVQEGKPRCSALLHYAQAHPGDAKASIFAAATLVTEGATEEQMRLARTLLDNAIATHPKLPEAHYQIGLLMQNQSDWAGSISPLETAIALKPNDAQAHYRLSLAYWRCGRKQEAQAEMALQKKYSKQQQEDLDQRLRQITTFLVDVHGNN